MKKLLKSMLALTLAAATFSAFGAAETHASTKLKTTTEKPAAALTFGVTLQAAEPDAAHVNKADYQHFVTALSKQLNTPIKLAVYPNQTKLIDAVAQGKVNLAYAKVVPFVQAQLAKKSMQPLATVLSWNENKTQKLDTYASQLAVLANNQKINSATDLKGMKIAFSRESASGFYYPSYFLQTKGIDYTYHFYNNQYDALRALKENKVSVAAVWNANFNINRDKIKLKTIETITNIPNPVIIADAKMSTQQQTAVEQGLMALPAAAYKGLAFAGVENFNANLYAEAQNIIQSVKGPAA